jgi:hypothetical protein
MNHMDIQRERSDEDHPSEYLDRSATERMAAPRARTALGAFGGKNAILFGCASRKIGRRSASADEKGFAGQRRVYTHSTTGVMRKLRKGLGGEWTTNPLAEFIPGVRLYTALRRDI